VTNIDGISHELTHDGPNSTFGMSLVRRQIPLNLLLLNGDELELAQDVLGEPGDLDTASSGLVGRVELFVDGIELGKVAHVLQEDLSEGGRRGYCQLGLLREDVARDLRWS
jgi:hypothetical protein